MEYNTSAGRPGRYQHTFGPSNANRKDLGQGLTMGKKRRMLAAKAAQLTSRYLKKQKTSHSQLAENPGGRLQANSGLDNPLAKENQKLETRLPDKNVKKKKNKRRGSKNVARSAAARTDPKTAELTSLHIEKPKTSHSKLAENLGGPSKANSGLDNSLANENQKLETSLSAENVERKKNKSRSSKNSVNREIFKQQLCKGGIVYFKQKPLDELLEKLSRAIEAAEQLKGQVHDNIWMKQMFSVGINDVTRTLERLPIAKTIQNNIPDIKHPELVPETFGHFTTSEDEDVAPNKESFISLKKTGKQVIHLQAVLAAIDCHPRVLVGHLPNLTSSRDVPLLCIEDHGSGSLRLGQLVKLKRAGAIGVKVGKSEINKAIQDIIDDQSMRRDIKMAAKPEDIVSD